MHRVVLKPYKVHVRTPSLPRIHFQKHKLE